MTADEVDFDFSGGFGKAELRKRLADQSLNLWYEPDRLVGLGCATIGTDAFPLPWYFSQDFGDLDVLNAFIVSANDEPLLEQAHVNGKQIALISRDSVTALGNPDSTAKWVEVRDHAGHTGCMLTDRLRSIASYRMTASAIQAKWRVTHFNGW